MENEILQNLEDVGYTGPLLDSTKLSEALQGGAKSPEFTGLVSWLTDQIGSFGGFDETVHPTSTPEDANSFLLELSTFLKELGCVNKKLTTGNVNQRLASIEAKNTLLEYLVVELMTCKILESKKTDTTKSVQITISESITAKNMREMLTALRFQKPPENITPELLFKKLHTKVSEVVKQVPKELIGKPLFFGELNNDQWEKLNKMQSDFNDEYTIRREMLLQRLDVTVNSFAWSERIRPKEDQLSKCYHSKRDAMKRDPDVTLANLLSAREDLAIIEKTSSASVRKNTRSAINKVIIGAVPDRGGRPCEQEPPPPEMPSWQKDRVQGPQGQRGGFGGGGGGRGGGGRGGGRGGSGSGGQGGGGGYRDNKSASSNFGQNFEQKPTSFGNLSFGNQFGSQAGGYGNKGGSSYSSSNFSGSATPAYGNKNTGYGGNSSSSGYSNQSGGYGNQSSSYSNQGSGYSNQGSGYSNQGGYDRKSGGDYNKGGRGGRVQGGWNQGGDSNSSNYNKGGYNNRGQGQGGQRY